MRVVDAFDLEVRAVAVSADGRYLAASSGSGTVGLWDWQSGREVGWLTTRGRRTQLALSPDGRWLASVCSGSLAVYAVGRSAEGDRVLSTGPVYAGGVGFTPDGKHLVAVSQTLEGRLERWSVPGWKDANGFDYWDPFTRLAVSPDGQFIAGIHDDRFELRVAVTGGLISRVRERAHLSRHPFAAFPRDSRTVAFGWGAEVLVMDTATGGVVRRVEADPAYQDAAFTGSGRQLGTVDGAGVLRLWDADRWAVAVSYDWAAGPLTCVAFTADGLAGVCGTAGGQLVLFDLD